VPPSTVPVVERSPVASSTFSFLLLKMTPISFARISLPSRISSSDGALMILESCAMRKSCEKTENCCTRSRCWSSFALPSPNHSQKALPCTIGWLVTTAMALSRKVGQSLDTAPTLGALSVDAESAAAHGKRARRIRISKGVLRASFPCKRRFCFWPF
jgi:hypothetical protein